MLKVDNKIYLSWDDVTDLVDTLCEKIITELPNIDSVFGLKRGGLIPAVMVSHKLGLPWSDVMLPNTLVIDDICDTGVTLLNTVGCYTAVLHHKPHTARYTPSICAVTHDGDEWINYPWERNDSKSIQDYLKTDEFQEFAERVDESGPWSEEYDKIHLVAGMSNDKERGFLEFQRKMNNKLNK